MIAQFLPLLHSASVRHAADGTALALVATVSAAIRVSEHPSILAD